MKLNLGSGPNQIEGYVGMDKDPYEGVEIIHDIEVMPYPIESNAVTHIVASHVLEHIKPWKIIDVMNELWRIIQPGCELDIRTPYGDWYRFDPTHCIHFSAVSWSYFDHRSEYYETYRPRPWECLLIEDTKDIKELHAILRKKEL